MTTDKPAVIVNVSLAGSDRDYDQHVTFLEQEFHLRRIGTNGDVAAAEELVRKWADDADVIAVTGIREARVAGLYDGDLEAVNRVKRATRMIPVTDGHALRDVLQEWSIRHVQNMMPGYFTNARVVVLGGMNHARTIRILQEYTRELRVRRPAAPPRRPQADGRQPGTRPCREHRNVAGAPAPGTCPVPGEGPGAPAEQLVGAPRPRGRPRHRCDPR